MRRILRVAGATLLWVLVLLCLAPTVVPPFLDRIYYRGPAGAHYDGERFFNPGAPEYRGGGPQRYINRWLGGGPALWPDNVPVVQDRPPPRVMGGDMRVSFVGHATVLVQTQGLNILTDPIWAERASPFPFVGPRRHRAPGIAFDALPKIDLILVSHNHYDHMDMRTLRRLWGRDRPLIVTGLGNDTILAKDGIASVARDWGGRVAVKPGIEVIVERNHHWSSRWGTDRNRALWSAFTVTLPGGNIYFAGDTGHGDRLWAGEAASRGPVRLALIPIGAYAPRDFMRDNHIDPIEAVRVFQTLDPVRALGIHWGTFQLTFEPIDEPRQLLAAELRRREIAPGRFIAPPAGSAFMVPAAAEAR